VAVFGGQRRHRRLIDVGRVADDQIKGRSRQAGEQVRLVEHHPLRQPQGGDIALRQRQRARIDIGGIHARLGERVRAGRGDAAAAGPDLQDAFDRPRADPGREAGRDGLGEGRARHEHTLIDFEWQPREPGLAGEIGRRPALFQASPDECAHSFHTAVIHRRGRIDGGIIGGVTGAREHEPGRLVARIIGAVTIGQRRRRQRPFGPFDQGQQRGRRPRDRHGDTTPVRKGARGRVRPV